ncbi:hypothetical protein DPMN_130974 [Dreissena polymorpha]|uniref:TGF-beta family profile domain-containing protein n=2 Tax=Dreissena polymorpha TaxID=45954 RepID=A0A9D4H8M6_DREPO|nr:hypothetical protein DPMN_130974 [Dreissena polymorpha]
MFACTILPWTIDASDLSELPVGQLDGAADEILRQPFPGSETEEAEVRDAVDIEQTRRHRHPKFGKIRDGVNKKKIAETVNSESEDYDILKATPEPINDDVKIEPEVNEEKDDESPQSTDQYPVTNSDTPSCENCLDKQELIQMQIERIKKTLLARLGLDSPPKVVGEIPPLPFDFYWNEDFGMSDEEYRKQEIEEENRRKPKIREIFIKGTGITEKCFQQKGTGCYAFNVSADVIDPALVSKIELWVYKQSDPNDHYVHTFMVSDLAPFQRDGKDLLRIKNIVKRQETRLKHGWMKIYVKRSVLRWLSKPHMNHGLAIVCRTCKRQNHRTIYGDKEGLLPILVFYMRETVPGSKKWRRSTPCTEGGDNCCHREALHINFRDIGWDYIMAPPAIRPNYCTGSCNGVHTGFYNHTRLVQTIHQTVAHNHLPIQNCCGPVSFKQLTSLLYRDDAGVIRKVDIPDLVVNECGCL